MSRSQSTDSFLRNSTAVNLQVDNQHPVPNSYFASLRRMMKPDRKKQYVQINQSGLKSEVYERV